ncbi:MAG: malectin domain-containing carbohydrate-binding protein [Thermomicrobiales bacterium]
MPRGAAPRALLGVLALFIAIAVAVVPVVDARPKDKKDGKQETVATETVPAEEPVPADAALVEAAPVVEQPLTANEGTASNDRTLLELDGDGDYIPDALDNCAAIQNPDQADADGDGHGDACPVYQDTDGDTVPDKQDNCPTVATSDFSDNDGDGVGNPCDKSPDGIEPEPEPAPDLDGRGGASEAEPPAPENGAGLQGEEVERNGHSRSKERQRTDISRPVITTGSDGEAAGTGEELAQEETPVEEPVRDNPRRNEELIAEAAASGELYAPPEPPPAPRRAWDEDAAGAIQWDSIVRIDAGATGDATATTPDAADDEPNDAGRQNSGERGEDRRSRDRADEVGDSEFARGWVRAKLLLQDELQGDGEPEDEPANDGGRRDNPAPVPVENGLVITGAREDENQNRATESDPATDDAENQQEPPEGAEPLDETAPDEDESRSANDRQQNGRDGGDRSARRDGSRRDGSSRAAAAAPARQQANDNDDEQGNNERDKERDKERRDRRSRDRDGTPQGWSEDRYYSGGSALNWSGDIGVAGTDDDGLYLTQRSGSGPGKRRGFEYSIPVEESGVYLVRLYFAEPYWGAPGGPNGDEGQRVFSVDAEGDTILKDLDVFGEVGAVTALVKQAEIEVEDGELNLRFIASEGEPIVAAIEILQPAN